MNKFFTALKTNENNARTKTLIAAGITVATIGAGIYLTKLNALQPIFLEVTEVAADTATEIADKA